MFQPRCTAPKSLRNPTEKPHAPRETTPCRHFINPLSISPRPIRPKTAFQRNPPPPREPLEPTFEGTTDFGGAAGELAGCSGARPVAGQRFGEVFAGFGPFEGSAPFLAGLFAAPSACEADPDGERRSQGVVPSSEYFGSKMLRPRCAGSSAFAALQSLAQPLPGCRHRVAGALGRAAGQAEPPLCPLSPGQSRCRGAGSRGRDGLPPRQQPSFAGAGATWRRASSAWPASGSSA